TNDKWALQAIRIAGGTHISLPPALPVLLQPDALSGRRGIGNARVDSRAARGIGVGRAARRILGRRTAAASGLGAAYRRGASRRAIHELDYQRGGFVARSCARIESRWF